MDKNYRAGILYGLGAYLLWGVLPIYWKLLQHVEAMEILASRFLWSVAFVSFLLIVTGRLQTFVQETKAIFSTSKTACCMAVLGIGVIIVQNGGLPWVAMTLPLTFALYSLLKKIIVAQPLTSIMIETLLISPLAAGYLYYLSTIGNNVYQACDTQTLLLLAGAGVVTATPLLLFTACARKLPLKLVGFLQYIAPSITLLLGVFVYGEPFTSTIATAFGCIWLGLVLFIWSQVRH